MAENLTIPKEKNTQTVKMSWNTHSAGSKDENNAQMPEFMRVQLVLRLHLHLCYLLSPLAQSSQLGISWRLWSLLRLSCAGCLVSREYNRTVLNVRESP